MKKIYLYLNKIISLIAVMLLMNSCLEKYPENYIQDNEAMLTFSDAEQTLTGIYSAFMSSSLYSGYLTLCPDIQSDLVYAVEGNSNNMGSFWLWNFLPTSREIEAVYASLYRVIARCNFYLDKVDDLKASLTNDDEIRNLDFYTGEVYCARALAYSELLKCFCEAYKEETAKDKLGVVLRSEYYKEETARRSSLEESYRFVINDLIKAESLLDEKYDSYNNVYFSKAAAHAIHARVALYMEDWETAIEYSSKILDKSDVFRLATTDEYSNGYSYLDYLWTNDSSFEIIWKIGFNQTSYGGALGSPFLNITTDFTYYYPDYVPAQWVLDSYDQADARYDAYFATLQTGYSHQLAWPLLVKYYGNESLVSYNIYHVTMPKPLRLAEQYLIRAEAYCRQGDYYLASKDLSALKSARYTSSVSASVSEDNWLDVISDERVKELYMEGFRLHDLKRWNKGFERKHQTSVQKEGSSMKIKADNPMFVWPIPKNELESPGSEIEPNPSNK